MSTQERLPHEQQRAWDALDSVHTDPAVQTWLRDIEAAGPARRPWAKRHLWALAATVLIALAGGTLGYLRFAYPHYETRVGEQRDVLLPDGSRVILNTDTALTVRYSKSHRYIDLQRGEALFAVKHDAQWPFEVAAGGTLTRALGTQFAVDLRMANVTVSVLEGAVKVAAVASLTPTAGAPETGPGSLPPGMTTIVPALAKGEAVQLQSQDHRVVTEKADLRRIAAWRTRRLDFSNTPLVEAVEEFNRYSATHVVIGTRELESVRVSGVFSIGDADGFMFSLKEALGVSSLESPGEVTIVRKSL